MDHVNPLLIQAAVYFAAAVTGVVLSHRLGLGSVAGYLLAGIAIGPWGLNLAGQVEDVRGFAEIGVVFLLFVIGLELEPKRLWEMRGQLVRLGLSKAVAKDMAHLPIGGAGGSLAGLVSLRARKIYTHVNNTNPILLETSEERRTALAAGWEVAFDGMEITP